MAQHAACIVHAEGVKSASRQKTKNGWRCVFVSAAQVLEVFQENPFVYDGIASGLCQDQETGLSYNYFRDYDPATGRYVQSDPIGLNGRSFSTYSYVNGNPLKYIDSRGLEAELCSRPFYPVPIPYAEHCFIRFNGNDSDTSSYDTGGTHADPAPSWWPKSCQPTKGEEDDGCVKREMKKCKAEDYDFTGNNCCHCAEKALKACGLSIPVKNWPNWPVNPGPQPGEKRSKQ